METRTGGRIFGRRGRRTGPEAVEPPAPVAAQEDPDPSEPRPSEELRARREEIARMEERALRETESLEIQREDLERRRQALADRERTLDQQAEELKRQRRVQRRELEKISGLSVAQAKQLLVADVETEAKAQAGMELKKIEEETKREAERRARNILAVSMQRLAATHASETTTRTIQLPNEEMK
jgi:ribonucrease Y